MSLASRADQPVMTVGVVADTHVPDRVDSLHPDLLDRLSESRVDLILHAGDICSTGVLEALGKIAPWAAVSGNRDVVFYRSLPLVQKLDLAGVEFALMHGHGGFWSYWRTKMRYLIQGYRLSWILPVLKAASGNAKVVIFGHSHFAENFWLDGKLFFNPGSACLNEKTGLSSFGLLRIFEDGEVKAEIVPLCGMVIRGRRWEPV